MADGHSTFQATSPAAECPVKNVKATTIRLTPGDLQVLRTLEQELGLKPAQVIRVSMRRLLKAIQRT
jgi:hypothetical protein